MQKRQFGPPAIRGLSQAASRCSRVLHAWSLAASSLVATVVVMGTMTGCLGCEEPLQPQIPQMSVNPRLFDVTVGLTTTETFAVEIVNPSNVSVNIDGVRTRDCDPAFSIVESSIPALVEGRGRHDVLLRVRPTVESVIGCVLVVDAEDGA